MIELIKEAFWQNAVSSFKAAALVILFLFALTKLITKDILRDSGITPGLP